MAERTELLLQVLLDSFRLGPDQLGHALEQVRGELTPELAQLAQQQYQAAVQSQDPGAAIAAATVASRVFNFMGRREDAFNGFLDYLYVLFMLAQTAEAYAQVHASIEQLLAGDPYGEGSPLTGLRAVLLQADSAFFACEAAAPDADKKRWLRAALEALQKGAKFLADTRSKALIPGYASTTVAVYRRCVNSQWIGEPWAAASLGALTIALDGAAPGEVSYPGNDSKTKNISEAREEMAAIYDRSAYIRDRTSEARGQRLFGLFGRKSG